MITTDDDVIVTLDSIEKYSAPNLVCFPTYNVETEIATVEVSIRDSNGVHLRYETFYLSKVDLDIQTISATDNTDKWMETIEETMISKLESLNPTATFTIE